MKETTFGLIPSHWGVSDIKSETTVVTDYVANGSFASLAENVQYKTEEDFAVLIRLVDYNNHFSGDFIYIDEHAYNFLRKSQLFGDEIIISNVGNVGVVFKCPKLKTKMALAPNSIMVKFNSCNDFYYYWLKSPYGQGMLQSIVTGSAQPKFNKTNFKSMAIPVPPLSEQKKIAAVLSALDEKIETNRKINARLEELAQAIFKSWFIDFEPFGGQMPNDWKTGALSDIADIVMGQSPKGSSLNQNNDGIIFYQGKTEFGDRFPTVKNFTTEITRVAPANSILLSVRAPVGAINITLNECCIGRGIASLNAKNGINSYLYLLLQNSADYFDVFDNGGTVFGCINKNALQNMPVTLPPQSIIDSFNQKVHSIDQEIERRSKESARLAELRDTLLPKLMSGELKPE